MSAYPSYGAIGLHCRLHIIKFEFVDYDELETKNSEWAPAPSPNTDGVAECIETIAPETRSETRWSRR